MCARRTIRQGAFSSHANDSLPVALIVLGDLLHQRLGGPYDQKPAKFLVSSTTDTKKARRRTPSGSTSSAAAQRKTPVRYGSHSQGRIILRQYSEYSHAHG